MKKSVMKPILEDPKVSLKTNWYKKAQSAMLWHISNEKFTKFDSNKAAQSIIWFAKDKEDLINNLHGASINRRKPVYLYGCQISMKKVAGWHEYDKYGICQLESMGYDTIDLDGDIAILDENNISIVSIEEVK